MKQQHSFCNLKYQSCAKFGHQFKTQIKNSLRVGWNNPSSAIWRKKNTEFAVEFTSFVRTDAREILCLAPFEKCIFFYNFTDITKFMVLFHLQRLGAENKVSCFSNVWKMKCRKRFCFFFFKILHFHAIVCVFWVVFTGCSTFWTDNALTPAPFPLPHL